MAILGRTVLDKNTIPFQSVKTSQAAVKPVMKKTSYEYMAPPATPPQFSQDNVAHKSSSATGMKFLTLFHAIVL